MSIASTAAPVAEPSMQDQAAAVAAPSKKTKAVKAPKVRAESLWSTLQKAFSRNQSYTTICTIVGDKHPKSKFNSNSVLHFNYYRAKFNMAAGKAGTTPTTSVGPVKVKAEPKVKKAAGKKGE